MKSLSVVFILFFAVSCFGFNKNSLRAFSQYYQRVKNNHDASEKRMIEVGERHLKKHARMAEHLTLAEMLPKSALEIPEFCKTYPNQVLSYYNLKSAKNLKNIQSSSFKAFNTMVIKECKKK